MDTKDTKPPIEVPQKDLSHKALLGIIENFILREGTDYGVNEVTLEVKVKQVQNQILNGDVKIIFDPNTETVGLITKVDWLKGNT